MDFDVCLVARVLESVLACVLVCVLRRALWRVARAA